MATSDHVNFRLTPSETTELDKAWRASTAPVFTSRSHYIRHLLGLPPKAHKPRRRPVTLSKEPESARTFRLGVIRTAGVIQLVEELQQQLRSGNVVGQSIETDVAVVLLAEELRKLRERFSKLVLRYLAETKEKETAEKEKEKEKEDAP